MAEESTRIVHGPTFKNLLDNSQSMVLQKGEIKPNQPTVVRVHVENILSDVFGSQKHISSISLDAAMETLSKCECGVLVYLRKEGLSSLLTQEVKSSTVETVRAKMDPREYGIGAQILHHLGVRKIHLLAHQSVSKVVGLKGFGLEVETVISIDGTETGDEPFLSAFKH